MLICGQGCSSPLITANLKIGKFQHFFQNLRSIQVLLILLVTWCCDTVFMVLIADQQTTVGCSYLFVASAAQFSEKKESKTVLYGNTH